jgi:hypothetical protein
MGVNSLLLFAPFLKFKIKNSFNYLRMNTLLLAFSLGLLLGLVICFFLLHLQMKRTIKYTNYYKNLYEDYYGRWLVECRKNYPTRDCNGKPLFYKF